MVGLGTRMFQGCFKSISMVLIMAQKSFKQALRLIQGSLQGVSCVDSFTKVFFLKFQGCMKKDVSNE